MGYVLVTILFPVPCEAQLFEFFYKIKQLQNIKHLYARRFFIFSAFPFSCPTDFQTPPQQVPEINFSLP